MAVLDCCKLLTLLLHFTRDDNGRRRRGFECTKLNCGEIKNKSLDFVVLLFFQFRPTKALSTSTCKFRSDRVIFMVSGFIVLVTFLLPFTVQLQIFFNEFQFLFLFVSCLRLHNRRVTRWVVSGTTSRKQYEYRLFSLAAGR